MYSSIPAMYFCRSYCCYVVGCCTAVAAAAAAVHRVPDYKICCCGSLHLIPVFSFSSLKHDLFSLCSLAVLSHFNRRLFAYNTYHTSLAITGMRGAKTGVSPPRRSFPCNKYMYRYAGHIVSAIELDLDQVFSRQHPSSRLGPPFGVVFARRASPCSSLPALPGTTPAVLASSP